MAQGNTTGNEQAGGGLGRLLLNIGAITGPIIGIAGFGLAVIVYRRQIASEKRDLRIQVRERRDEVEQALARFRDVHRAAHGSRIAVLVALGRADSGPRQSWEQLWKADAETADELESQLPDRNAKYDGSPDSILEDRLVDLGRLKRQIETLITKYEGEIRNDDAQRDRIHANLLATRRKPSS